MFPSLTRPFSLTQLDLARDRYELAEAHVRLVKVGAAPVKVHALSGELYATPKGWVMLRVPNALVRGAFDALDEQGAQLALHNGKLNAHISVIRPDEVESLGGVDKISERGHHFHYTLGPVKEVEPAGWPEMSKVWFIEVKSPELENLRKSYGLSNLPKDGEHQFHITVAVRKKSVLRPGDTTKHAEELDPEIEAEIDKEIAEHRKEKRYLGRYKCPHCGGTNLFNGIPGTGTTFRGSGVCDDCKKSCSIVGSKLKRLGDGPEIVSSAEQEDDYRKMQRWMKKSRRETAEAEKTAGKRGPEGEYCPHCDARLERDPDSGTCNRCGKPWPVDAVEKLAHLISVEEVMHPERYCKVHGCMKRDCGCGAAEKLASMLNLDNRDLALFGALPAAGGLVNAGVNAMMSEKGKRREAAMRGLLTGSMGGLAGAGFLTGVRKYVQAPDTDAAIAPAVGTAAGAYGLSQLLLRGKEPVADKVLGPAPWKRPKKKEKPGEKP